jgi:protein-S-isoprenylcysteine O-methyltransferase Ste14
MEIAGFNLPPRLLAFILLSAANVVYSWPTLRKPHRHGFYRFFIFEGAAALLVLSGASAATASPEWLRRVAQLLHLLALIFVATGYLQLRRAGGHQERENFPANRYFENTALLVTTGIYRYIRHPMYSALLLFVWGMLLADLSWPGLAIALLTTAFLLKAVLVEEQENIAFFGQSYVEYMHRTRRFFPFLI